MLNLIVLAFVWAHVAVPASSFAVPDRRENSLAGLENFPSVAATSSPQSIHAKRGTTSHFQIVVPVTSPEDGSLSILADLDCMILFPGEHCDRLFYDSSVPRLIGVCNGKVKTFDLITRKVQVVYHNSDPVMLMEPGGRSLLSEAQYGSAGWTDIYRWFLPVESDSSKIELKHVAVTSEFDTGGFAQHLVVDSITGTSYFQTYRKFSLSKWAQYSHSHHRSALNDYWIAVISSTPVLPNGSESITSHVSLFAHHLNFGYQPMSPFHFAVIAASNDTLFGVNQCSCRLVDNPKDERNCHCNSTLLAVRVRIVPNRNTEVLERQPGKVTELMRYPHEFCGYALSATVDELAQILYLLCSGSKPEQGGVIAINLNSLHDDSDASDVPSASSSSRFEHRIILRCRRTIRVRVDTARCGVWADCDQRLVFVETPTFSVARTCRNPRNKWKGSSVSSRFDITAVPESPFYPWAFLVADVTHTFVGDSISTIAFGAHPDGIVAIVSESQGSQLAD